MRDRVKRGRESVHRSQGGGDSPAHSQETLPTAHAQSPLSIQGAPKVLLTLAPKHNFYSLIHRRAQLCKHKGEKGKQLKRGETEQWEGIHPAFGSVRF